MRINLFKFDPVHSRFVDQKILKLCKSPIAMLCAVIPASNRSPRTDVGQVFNLDRAIRVFGLENQPLRNKVVGIFLETRLLICHLLQVAFSRLTATLLQRFTQLGIAFAGVFNTITTENIAITGHGDIGHAHVNAQRLIGLPLVRVRNIADSQEKKLFGRFAIDQITLPLSVLQQFSLAYTTAIGDMQTTSYRPDTYCFLLGVPRQNTVIIGIRPVWLETAFALFIQLVGISNFSEHANDHLCRNPCFTPQLVIQRFVQIVGAKQLLLPRKRTDGSAQSISRLKCLQEVGRLFGRGIQSDLRNL